MHDDKDHDARNVAQSLLRTGERLLWSGRPDPWRIALQTLPLFILALPWIAAALYRTAASFDFRLPEFTGESLLGFWPFIGLFFTLLGLTLLALPWLAYRRAARTVYALTDLRCLIITAGKINYVEAYGEEDIGAIKRVDRRNGAGDLIFTASAVGAAKDFTRIRKAVFYGIPEVRLVEETARRAFRK